MGSQKKKIDLEKSCMEIINQNERLNGLFDKVALIYREANNEFCNRVLPTYSVRQKEQYDLQYSFHGYLLSLLEEIHRYSYFSLCEIFLYQERLSRKEETDFFSSIYFLSNASFHIIAAWERTLRLSGLLYGCDFNQPAKYSQIYDSLKKKETFTNTEVFLLIQELKNNNHFPDIEKLRKSNDHQLSEHVKYEKDDDLHKLAIACYENSKALYQIIQFYIDRFQNECFIRINGIDLIQFRWDLTIDSSKIETTISKELKRKLLQDRLNRCDEYITIHIGTFQSLKPMTSLFLTKLDENSTNILHHSDFVFRLHEATRSLKFAYNLMMDAKEKEKEFYEEIVCFVDMNYAYFIESAISRIYSVYDKIAILLHIYTGEGSKTSTFEQFMRNIKGEIKNDELLTFANSVFNREEYKELHQLRQNNFHHLVKENFINRVDSEWSHLYNMVLVSKNIEILKPMINKLMELFVDDPIGLRKIHS